MSDNIIQPKICRIDDLFQGELKNYIHSRVTDPLMNMGNFPPQLARDIRLYDWYQFTHGVQEIEEEISPLADVCKVILMQALDRSDRVLDRLFKIRIVNSIPGDYDRARPHIDLVGPHQTGIYFPEDSDGTTDVMLQRSWLESWDIPEKFDVVEQLEPKANTWYDFDGTHWRYTGRPNKFNNRYCVIFNFVAKPK